jgi:hypothetical protein
VLILEQQSAQRVHKCCQQFNLDLPGLPTAGRKRGGDSSSHGLGVNVIYHSSAASARTSRRHSVLKHTRPGPQGWSKGCWARWWAWWAAGGAVSAGQLSTQLQHHALVYWMSRLHPLDPVLQGGGGAGRCS